MPGFLNDLNRWVIIPWRPDSLAEGPGFEPRLPESESLIRIRLQSSSTTHRFGPIAERHGPADPEPFALRGCDLVTHALAVVAKSACESGVGRDAIGAIIGKC